MESNKMVGIKEHLATKNNMLIDLNDYMHLQFFGLTYLIDIFIV